jgi:uncharacterized protein DUF6282
MATVRGSAEIDLSGFVDLHVHAGPDVRPRLLDDLEVARQAAEAGMAGVLLKSHVTLTADRAAIAQKVVVGIRVVGALALNREVGGLNPAAVEVALKLGAVEVWLPTFSARGKAAQPGGIAVLDESGALLPVVREILALVRDGGAILGTGHLTLREISLVVREARGMGLRKLLVTHPENEKIVGMPVEMQRDLAEEGAMFERCYVSTLEPGSRTTVADIAGQIKAVGPRSTVISTDLGQASNPAPVEGLRAYAGSLLAAGLTPDELRLVAAENPARLIA